MTKARDIASATTPNANAALLATFPHRNLIINGAVQVWQRGTSQTSTGYGCTDRWRNTVSGTTTFSQDTASLPTGFEYALRWTTGASSSYGQSRQFIETSTIKILRGRTLTASAYVKVSGTYSGAVTWEIAYSTTSDVESGNTWVQLTETNVVTASASDASSDYKRISCNVTIPSNALGAYIGIVPSATQASGEWVSVTGVQLELGSSATPFEHRSFGDELQRCMRYYEKSYDYATAPGTGTAYPGNLPLTIRGMDEETSGQRYFVDNLKVEKRADPTNTYYDEQGNIGKVTTYDSGGTGTHNVSIGLVVTETSKYGAGPANSAIWGFGFYYECDAEL